jgi:hypothetical protein
MKIDPITKFISSIVPTKESDPASPLKDMPKLVKDVMEPLTDLVKTTNQTISTFSNKSENAPKSNKGDEEALERNMYKARMGGSQRKSGDDQVEKRKGGDDHVDKKKKGKNKDAGSGSTIFHEKDRVKDGKEVQYGDGVKGDLKKEISNVSGIIDWKKGYTILDKEAHLWRPIEFARELTTDKIGEASAKGRLDILAIRGRLFGLADLNWKKSAAELGLGVQAAFELIGGHIELKHDAPKVLLGGVDAALHTVINGDAYVGAVAEGGAILTLSWDDFMKKSYLQLGGQAFAGAAASISGSMSLGKLVGVNASADAYAGAGAKALLKVGFEDGTLHVDTGLGAAVAVGAGYDLGVSVNFLEIGKGLEGLGKQALDDPLAFPTDFLQDIGHVLGTNVGSGMYLLDAAFHLTGKSDVPSDYERPGERDEVTERLEEKKNQKPAQPVA